MLVILVSECCEKVMKDFLWEVDEDGGDPIWLGGTWFQSPWMGGRVENEKYEKLLGGKETNQVGMKCQG